MFVASEDSPDPKSSRRPSARLHDAKQISGTDVEKWKKVAQAVQLCVLLKFHWDVQSESCVVKHELCLAAEDLFKIQYKQQRGE